MNAQIPSEFRKDYRVALIAESYARLLGCPLAEGADVAEALWQSPTGIVAHGMEADPLFFFGNKAGLTAFAAPLDQFIGMPSRLSAPEMHREERARLFDRVNRDGFIDNYGGVRIKLNGDLFRIENAVVWNLVDASGVRHGQAAAFQV